MSDDGLKVIHVHVSPQSIRSESLPSGAFNCNSLTLLCSYQVCLTACKMQKRVWEVAKKVSFPSVLLAHMKRQRSDGALRRISSQPIGTPLGLDKLFRHSCNLSCGCNWVLIQTRRFKSPCSFNLPHVAQRKKEKIEQRCQKMAS